MKARITFFIVAFCAIQTFAQDVYLQCGEIFDSESGKFLSERTIVVSGNKIKSIEKGFTSGKDTDSIIDLRSKTVLPGFIDMHVHIESESNAKSYINEYTLNEADVAFDPQYTPSVL